MKKGGEGCKKYEAPTRQQKRLERPSFREACVYGTPNKELLRQFARTDSKKPDSYREIGFQRGEEMRAVGEGGITQLLTVRPQKRRYQNPLKEKTQFHAIGKSEKERHYAKGGFSAQPTTLK